MAGGFQLTPMLLSDSGSTTTVPGAFGATYNQAQEYTQILLRKYFIP